MPPTPSPTPLEVIVHAAPAADWQVWAAFAPLIAAIIAAGIAAGALFQRWKADNRAEWWRRAQWALDSSFSDNADQSKLGLGIMEDLANSAPGKDEARIIRIASTDPLQVAAEARFGGALADDEEFDGEVPITAAGAYAGQRSPGVVDSGDNQDDNETTIERER